MTVSVREFFPDCNDDVKEMIRQSIAILSTFDDPEEHRELMEKINSDTISEFWLSVAVDEYPVIRVNFKGFGTVIQALSVNPGYALPVNAIDSLLKVWHLPINISNHLTEFSIEGGGDNVVTWSGSGIVSREPLEVKTCP
jgi:hypothetical protein